MASRTTRIACEAIAVGQSKVGVIENVEEFGAKLDVFDFADAEIFDHREIPVGIAGADADISPGIAELLNRRVGIGDDLGEGGAVEPCGGGFRTGIWVLPRDDVGSIGGEASDFGGATLVRDVGGIEDSAFLR